MLSKHMSLKRRRMVYGYIFIAPWLIGFTAFFLRSLVTTIVFSFHQLKIDPAVGYTLEWSGWFNYIYALTEHADYNRILVESLQDIVIDVPLIIFFSLFIAILLNQKFRGRTVIRAIFFLPVILMSPGIVQALSSAMDMMSGGISTVPQEMQNTEGFSARYLIRTFIELGFPAGLLDYVEDAVNRVYDMVKASGVQILIFLAALQSIPGSLYEVAKIEGATAYESFWKVTLPMVSPLILTNVVYTIVDYFVVSEVVDVSYVTAFTNLNFGLSATMSIISTLMVSLILLVSGYLISRKVFYYNS